LDSIALPGAQSTPLELARLSRRILSVRQRLPEVELPAGEGADCVGIEADQASDAKSRKQTCVGAVVDPRPAYLEVVRDVVRIPKRGKRFTV
jgi:hypothetical protein